jgi:hypothetical protein
MGSPAGRIVHTSLQLFEACHISRLRAVVSEAAPGFSYRRCMVSEHTVAQGEPDRDLLGQRTPAGFGVNDRCQIMHVLPQYHLAWRESSVRS